MEKKDRLKDAVNYLVFNRVIKIQQDIADKMHKPKSTVSSALNGDERYLTTNFIRSFNTTFGHIFSEHWLLTGEGEMLQKQEKIIHNEQPLDNTSPPSLENTLLLMTQAISKLTDVTAANADLVKEATKASREAAAACSKAIDTIKEQTALHEKIVYELILHRREELYEHQASLGAATAQDSELGGKTPSKKAAS